MQDWQDSASFECCVVLRVVCPGFSLLLCRVSFLARPLSTFHSACSLAQVYKVPATDMEALSSPLMGFFEKRKAGKFFKFVQDYEEQKPETHNGMDLHTATAQEVFT